MPNELDDQEKPSASWSSGPVVLTSEETDVDLHPNPTPSLPADQACRPDDALRRAAQDVDAMVVEPGPRFSTTDEYRQPRSLAFLAPPTPMQQQFLDLLNAARADPTAYGRSISVDLSAVKPSQPLVWNAALTSSAITHSMDMVAKNYFAHNGSDGSNPGQRMATAGYAWTAWAESIAAGTKTPTDTLESLIKDAGAPDLGHRKMLLGVGMPNSLLRDIGIASAAGGSYGIVWTLDAGVSYAGPPPVPPTPQPVPAPTPQPAPGPQPPPIPNPLPIPIGRHPRPWWRRPRWLPAFFPWFTPGTSHGAQMIAHERHRQLMECGWTPQHDADYGEGNLAYAAACYAIYPGMFPGNMQFIGDVEYPIMWPFHPMKWKPKDRITDLVRAGALIAAEIDRLMAKEGK